MNSLNTVVPVLQPEMAAFLLSQYHKTL